MVAGRPGFLQPDDLRIPDPRYAASVRFFADPMSAQRHVCAHLLSEPECHGWALVDPTLRDHFDPEDGEDRYGLAIGQDPPRMRALCRAFANTLARAQVEAARLGWLVESPGVMVSLSPRGVLTTFRTSGREIVLLTSYLPLLGSAAIVERTRTQPQRLLRDSAGGMRSGRRARLLSPRERRQKQRHERAWGTQEKLYYYVFKNAVQYIHDHHHQPEETGAKRKDFALLKSRLPPRSRLKFRDWIELVEPNGARP